MPKNEIRAYLGINEIAEEGTRSFSISYNFSNHIRGISVHSYANADKLDDRFDRVTISRFIHDTRGYLTLSDVSMQPEGTLRGRGR